MTLLHPLGRLWEKDESCWMLKMRPRESHPAFTPTSHLYQKCLDRTQLCQFSNLACWLSWEIYSKASLHFTPAWPCTRQYSLNLLGLLSPPALILHDLESCVPSWVRILGFQPHHPHLHNLWCCLGTASGGVNWSPSRGEGLTHTSDTYIVIPQTCHEFHTSSTSWLAKAVKPFFYFFSTISSMKVATLEAETTWRHIVKSLLSHFIMRSNHEVITHHCEKWFTAVPIPWENTSFLRSHTGLKTSSP